MNHELPDVQAGFRHGSGTRDQIANIHWTMKKAREFQKNIYLSFIDYAKAFDCVDHNELWKILQARLQQYVNQDLYNYIWAIFFSFRRVVNNREERRFCNSKYAF